MFSQTESLSGNKVLVGHPCGASQYAHKTILRTKENKK